MQRLHWILSGAAIVVVAALAVPTVRHLREEPPPPPPPVHLAFDAPPGAELGSVDEALDAAVSPDEADVVFVATTQGVAQLWRRALATGRTSVLPGTDGARFPAWKQSGGVVSFFADARLRQISLADGTVRDLADAPAPAGAAWLPDGSLLFAPSSRTPIRRLLEGRLDDATVFRPGDRGHAFPAASGSGGEFTYVAFRDDGRRTVRLAGPQGEQDLTDTGGHAQRAGAFLVYARDGVLLGARIDAETRSTVGRSLVLSPSVGVSPEGHAMFAVSPRLLLVSGTAPRPREIAWFDAAHRPLGRIAEPGDYWQVRLSSDDRLAAITLVDPLLRTLDVFVAPASGSGDATPVTRALAADTDPVWSPDGGRMVFRSLQSGRPMLFTRRVGLRGAEDTALEGALAGDTATDWRGRRVLVHTASTGASRSDIVAVDSQDGSRSPVAADPFNETDARWSPDGRWIAYVSDESGQPDVYVVRDGPPSDRVRVSFAGGVKPRWSADGRSIFFARGSRIMRAERVPGDMPRFAAAAPALDAPGLRDFDAAHRSDRLVVLLAAPGSRAPASTAIVSWQSLAGRQ